MRVITGSAKGAKLLTLPGTDIVRPTSEKVKEAIFSSIQFDIEGRKVLDLFAGSGQLGIEALSRGAESAVFVDASPLSLDIVNKNLVTAKLDTRAKVIKGDYSSYLLKCTDVFDLAFLDPPYNAGILIDALEKTAEHISTFGTVFCEHPTGFVMPESVNGLNVNRIYKFGTVTVTSYKRDVNTND